MQLQDYFDFLAPDDIRIKGTRVGIETVLYDYLERGRFPEEIALHYPSLSLEQVYATITYYWHDKDELDAYLQAWLEHGEQMWQEQQETPPQALQRIRQAIEQRRRKQPTEKVSTGGQ